MIIKKKQFATHTKKVDVQTAITEAPGGLVEEQTTSWRTQVQA